MIQPDRSMLYKAFISYSHAADGKLAPAIQSALHRFARPWYKPRALRVFRDKTSLAVSPALWPAIVKALGQAEYFILFASPGAARSVWVEREVDYWLANRSRETLLIVLTEGELFWDPAASDFDWRRSDALPKRLAGAMGDEPFHLDLRWAQKSEQLSLREPRFRDSVAQLASTLHGRPLDELIGEDVRQHRRTKRLAWGAVTALALLTLISIAAAYIAIRQRNLANERLQIATSRQLTVEALGAGREIDQALLLAVEATVRYPTMEAQAALQNLLERAGRLETIVHRAAAGFAFGPDGASLAIGSVPGPDARGRLDPVIERFDTTRWQRLGEELRAVPPGPEAGDSRDPSDPVAAIGLGFAPDGLSLLASHADGMHPPRYRVFQLDLAGAPAAVQAGGGDQVALLPGGRAAIFSQEQGVTFWSGGRRRGATVSQRDATPIWLASAPAGDHIAIGYHDGATELWTDLEGSPRSIPLALEAEPIASAAFSPSGDLAFFGSDAGTIFRFRLAAGEVEELPPLEQQKTRVAGLAVSGTELVSVAESGEILAWPLAIAEPSSSLAGRLEPPVAAAFFSPDGRRLAALRRAPSGRPQVVELWLRPERRGHFQAAANWSAVSDGYGTGELLPVLAAEPIAQTISVFHRMTGRGSLGWSFDPPPVAFDLAGERLALRLPASGSPFTRIEGGGLAVFNLGPRRAFGWRFPEGASGLVASAAISPDGRWLAWASETVVEVVDLEQGRRADPLPLSSREASAVAFSRDGETLAVAATQVGDPATWLSFFSLTDRGERQPPIELGGERGCGMAKSLAFDPTGKRVFVFCDEQELFAIDLSTGAQQVLLGEPQSEEEVLMTHVLVVHPSRPLLAFGAGETALALLDTGAAKPRLETLAAVDSPVQSLAFHPDGDTVAAALLDGRIHFYSLTERREKGLPLDPPAGLEGVHSLAFDDAGGRLAVAYPDAGGARLRLWDLARRAPAAPDLAAPQAAYWHQLLLPGEGRHLVWATAGSGPVVWDVALEGRLQRACRVAGRDLTEEEWKIFLPFDPYRRTCDAYRRPPSPE
jgi:WD40 repeat protein